MEEHFPGPPQFKRNHFQSFLVGDRKRWGVGVCSKVGSGSNTNQYEPRTLIWQRLRERTDPVTLKPIDGRFWAIFDTLTYNNEEQYDAAVVQLGKFAPWKPNAPQGTGFTLQGNNECSTAIPIYRYADVVLLRAEALAHTGRYQEALDIVNNVRKRVGYTVTAKLTDYTGDVMTGVENTILDERQLELLAEGKRWFDLCRIGKIYDYTDNGYGYLKSVMNPILSTVTGGIPFSGANMGRVLFPINSAAFNANRKLLGDQNAPYDE